MTYDSYMEKVIPSSLLNRIGTQPADLVSDLLAYVPREVLINPATRVADLAMGGGDYLAAVLKLRLDAGVPRE
jgi:hypothetical protein